jgi:hypothetical protein
MDGIIWLFLALIIALVALGAVLVGLRRRPQRHSKRENAPRSFQFG